MGLVNLSVEVGGIWLIFLGEWWDWSTFLHKRWDWLIFLQESVGLGNIFAGMVGLVKLLM